MQEATENAISECVFWADIDQDKIVKQCLSDCPSTTCDTPTVFMDKQGGRMYQGLGCQQAFEVHVH